MITKAPEPINVQVIDPSNQLNPRSAHSASRSRSPSPSGTIAIDFAIASQMSRLNMLTSLEKVSQLIDIRHTSMDEIISHIQTVGRQWEKFESEHDKLGQASRRALFTHSYMTNNVYELAFNIYNNAIQIAHRQL
ncbi:hypothetical protein PV326_001278, partial [Microctonus aethiopoides]